jgi:methylated-DNA-[protein]-cysteine S-methyltransferase
MSIREASDATGRTWLVASPVGTLRIDAQGDFVAGIRFAAPRAPVDGPCDGDGVLALVQDQLGGYFTGDRLRFDLPLYLPGSTFQRAVWAAVVAVPYGTTTTYREIADGLGRPTAARAVGAANARNPISIVVPCHRVVAASGDLTGYSGGIAVKRWLLEHEQRVTRSGGAPGGASPAEQPPNGTEVTRSITTGLVDATPPGPRSRSARVPLARPGQRPPT